GEAIGRRQWHEFDLAGVVENFRRERAAEIDVESAPVAFVVLRGKTGQSLGDTARHGPPLDDFFQGLRRSRSHRENESRRNGTSNARAYHGTNPFGVSGRYGGLARGSVNLAFPPSCVERDAGRGSQKTPVFQEDLRERLNAKGGNPAKPSSSRKAAGCGGRNVTSARRR